MIVVITSLVTLNVGSGGRDIRLEGQVRNLADVASYALDEAQLLGRDFGLLLQQSTEGGEMVFSYAWRERRDRGWDAPASGADVFEVQYLPPDIDLVLELEGAPVAAFAGREPRDEPAPQVLFYASGETTPGSLEFRRRLGGELLWQVQWDLLGRFTALRRGEQEEPW